MTRTTLSTLALSTVSLLAACTFSAQDPAVTHCSAAEPACPAGTTCNVATGLCVGKGADSRADLGGKDVPADTALDSGDGPKADRAHDLAHDHSKTDKPTYHEKGTDKPIPDKGVPSPDKLIIPDKGPDKYVPTPDLGPPCGNGVINAGEDCDGGNLNGQTCQSQGRNGGTLKCVACKFSLTACCAAPLPPATVTPTAIVSASAGNDATTQPLCLPYKTITKALNLSTSTSVIWVAPGTYNAANGETFPLALPDKVSLVGDAAGKGGGSSPTVIDGGGTLSLTGQVTGIYAKGPAGQGSVRGFKFTAQMAGSSGIYAVVNNGLPITIDSNTLASWYGIWAGGSGNCPTISNNLIQTSATGIGVVCQGNTLLVDKNTFKSSGSVGLYVMDGAGSISNNTFNVGAQVDNAAAPTFTGNTFDVASGAALTFYSSTGSPKVRSCTFLKGSIVTNGTASSPDLGTGVDPGKNHFESFSGSTIFSLTAPGDVYAVGNTWPSTGTVCSFVSKTGGGTFTYGSGQTCP